MTSKSQIFDLIQATIQEIVNKQQADVLKCARRIVPTITPEDVLQPNDYQELENNPHFRFEEGLLIGAQTVQMALLALQNDIVFSELVDDDV